MSTTTINAARSGAASKKGLTAKDLVLLAVFAVVGFLIMMAFSMVFSFSTDLCWWTHAIGAIPVGIVWMYLMAKVPKRGAAFIAGTIMGLLGLLMGMIWTGPVGMIIGAALCELIMIAGKRSVVSSALGYAAFVFCWWLGQLSLIIISGETYVQMIVDMGMTAEYGYAFIDWVNSPMFPLAGVTTIVTCLIGAFLGSKIFKKHFAKITA